jgi:hypothetical protein
MKLLIVVTLCKCAYFYRTLFSLEHWKETLLYHQMMEMCNNRTIVFLKSKYACIHSLPLRMKFGERYKNKYFNLITHRIAL